MIGNESLYKTSRGSRAMSRQNLAHVFQCLSAAAVQLAESPLAMSCTAAWKLSQKRALLEGSTGSVATTGYVKRQYL